MSRRANNDDIRLENMVPVQRMEAAQLQAPSVSANATAGPMLMARIGTPEPAPALETRRGPVLTEGASIAFTPEVREAFRASAAAAEAEAAAAAAAVRHESLPREERVKNAVERCQNRIDAR
jgi:cell envelope opacity-associated protein A